MSYTIVPWEWVKQKHPEFQATLADLEVKCIDWAIANWGPGRTYGGFKPSENQFGRTTILPDIFADENDDILDEHHVPTTWGMNSFRQLFTSVSPTAAAIPGTKLILQGGNPTNLGQMPKDILVGLAGFAIPSKIKPITKMWLQIGDIKYGKFDIEETFAYPHGVAFILEDGFLLPPEEGFHLYGWFEASGYVRVKPLGIEMYRRKALILP